MNRKEFLGTCGWVCLGAVVGLSTLSGCASYYAIHEFTSDKVIKVKRTEFTQDKNGKPINRKYVLIKSDKLAVPIVLFRISYEEYSALWMQCTHQGAELSAHGEILVCPSHGSEFDRQGQVLSGPAEQNLKKFKLTTDENYLYIHLA